MSSRGENGVAAMDDESDDDYMSMTFDEPTPASETSLQRTQRLKKESAARGVIKSKAQIAEEELVAREKALTRSLLDDPRSKKSKGLAMMAKMGFAGGGLGKKAENGEDTGTVTGRTEPIHLSVKEDRGGIGLDSEKKRRLREEADNRGMKAVKLDPDEYRERVRKEREDVRLEKQFSAAQRLAEQMDEEHSLTASVAGDEPQVRENGTTSSSKTIRSPSKPLKSVNILYRGLVRHRKERECDRRMRYDLDQSLLRLPTYEDDSEDDDYKKALGKDRTSCVVAEDLDEEDEELEEFNGLGIAERLRLVLVYLREQHAYCFWCKMAYAGKDMEGCPGITEEDHD